MRKMVQASSGNMQSGFLSSHGGGCELEPVAGILLEENGYQKEKSVS
jgi:hypothetical protein